jgi:N6-adenosine-specific RNA methylase IME4
MSALFPEQTFACLLADPPWLERGAGKSKRGADRHYPLLPTPEIPRVIRSSGLFAPAEHAHLWLWVTDNFLEDGLFVMRALGFRYVRTMVWVKAADEAELAEGGGQLGLGQYLRGQHEICLFGVHGKGKDPSVRTEHRDVPSVCYGRRGRHSAKPDSSYEAIERVSLGSRVEFFSRSLRSNWTSWGNDAAVAA